MEKIVINTTPSQPIGIDGQYLGASLKKCNKCGEFKALDGFSKNSRSRDRHGNTCKPCAQARANEYYQERLKGLRADARAADPVGYAEKIREANKNPSRKAWVESHKNHSLQKKRERLAGMDEERAKEHLETSKLQMRSWRAKNLEHCRAWLKAWAARNKDKIRLYSNTRRLKNRTPAWADRAAIELVYVEAQRLEAHTGIPHDVDHIYALKGKTVCGLNVQENLRPMPSKANGRKLNKLPGSEAHELWNPNGRDVYYQKEEQYA